MFLVLKRRKVDHSILCTVRVTVRKIWRENMAPPNLLFVSTDLDTIRTVCTYDIYIHFNNKTIIYFCSLTNFRSDYCYEHKSGEKIWWVDLFLEMCLHDVIRMVHHEKRGVNVCKRAAVFHSLWHRDRRPRQVSEIQNGSSWTGQRVNRGVVGVVCQVRPLVAPCASLCVKEKSGSLVAVLM